MNFFKKEKNASGGYDPENLDDSQIPVQLKKGIDQLGFLEKKLDTLLDQSRRSGSGGSRPFSSNRPPFRGPNRGPNRGPGNGYRGNRPEGSQHGGSQQTGNSYTGNREGGNYQSNQRSGYSSHRNSGRPAYPKKYNPDGNQI